MPRGEKVEAVADIKERLESANAVFLAEYAGLSVKDQQVLRRALRSGGAEFRVVKMTLARLAAGQLDIQALDDLLLGPTGIAFANGDVVSAAKALRDFSKDHDVFRIKGGLLGRDYLTPERVAELADIEPHEVLLSRMAAAFQAPMAKFAGLLAALPRGFATAMQQLLEDRQAAEPLQGVGNEGDSDGADDPAPSPDDQASADAETAAAEQEPAAIADAPSADGAPTEDTADADAAAARIPEAPYDGSDGAEDAIGEPAVDGGAGEVASGMVLLRTSLRFPKTTRAGLKTRLASWLLTGRTATRRLRIMLSRTCPTDPITAWTVLETPLTSSLLTVMTARWHLRMVLVRTLLKYLMTSRMASRTPQRLHLTK